MTTYNTGNPLGSAAAKDLYDNAQNLDHLSLDKNNEYYPDRLGNQRITWHGMEEQFKRSLADVGWILVESFQDGATITLINQALKDESSGEYYRWDGALPKVVPAGSTPDSSGGIGSGRWLSIGDASARQWVENNFIKSRFEKFGYFSQGSTLTSNVQALVDSSGLYWVKLGDIPSGGYVVSPGTNPDYPDFMCVGYLTDYDWMSVLNWGADNNYSISDRSGIDAVDSINLAGYHAEKRYEVFGSIQPVKIPSGTYLLDKTTLVEGVDHGLTIYRNQEVLIFERNGVDFFGDGDSTILFVADGVVERNKENGGTKGFIVFGDGIREIRNASIRNLLIDENGDNNLVPPPNWSGAQAHCPAVACYEGSNGVIVSGVNVKNAPGSNVMIFQESQAAFNSYDTLIENCSFYRVADAITGNTNLNDHSSIRIHSDGYLISNVKCIQPTMSDLCTVFECHGNGDVKKCLTKKARYPFLKANDGATAKSETTFSSCEFYDAGSALVLDCTPNKTSNAVFINNYGTLRSEKQNIGYFNNSAITSLQPNVINTPQQNIDINIVLNGNTVIQKERIGWPDDQITSNNIFNVLKIKSIKSNDNEFHGFRFAMNLREQKENASIYIDDVLYKCGVDGYGGTIDNTCIRYTNGYNSSYGVNLSELYVKYTMHSCLYGGFISILQTAAGESVGIEKCNIEYSSDTYIVPFLGISPKDAQQYYVNGECFADISTSSPLNGYSSVFGKFTVHSKQLGYSAVFSKPHNIVSPGWFFKGVMNVSGSVPDRPYGNNNGDRYDVITSATNIIGYKYNGTAWVEITI